MPVDTLHAPRAHFSVLRIVQEMLTNIIKHVHATEVTVATSAAATAAALSIVDIGRGLP